MRLFYGSWQLKLMYLAKTLKTYLFIYGQIQSKWNYSIFNRNNIFENDINTIKYAGNITAQMWDNGRQVSSYICRKMYNDVCNKLCELL